MLHSERRVGASRGWVVLALTGRVLWLGFDGHSGIDGRRAAARRCIAVCRMVHHVLSVHDVRVYQQRLQVLDVGAGQFQRVDLGQFSGRGVCGDQLAELVEGRVDCVHSLPLTFVGCCPFSNVLVRLDAGLSIDVFVAALVRAGTARATTARAPVVRCVAVLTRSLISALTVCALLRGRRFGVVIIAVAAIGEVGTFPLHSRSRQTCGRVAQRLHRRGHNF